MTANVSVIFPKGISIDQVSAALIAAMKSQNYQIDGQVDHHEEMINDQVVITDTWENEEKLSAFLNEFALPAFERAGLPAPDVKLI